MSDTATGVFRRYRLVVGEDKAENLALESRRMPAFKPPPPVVTYGARVFVLASTEDAEVLVYREGWAWPAAVEVALERGEQVVREARAAQVPAKGSG